MLEYAETTFWSIKIYRDKEIYGASMHHQEKFSQKKDGEVILTPKLRKKSTDSIKKNQEAISLLLDLLLEFW